MLLSTGPKVVNTSDPTEDRDATSTESEHNAGLVALEFLQPTTKTRIARRLAHYEVLEVLGRGAFGIVVRAFDEKLQRVVAIKVLSPHLAATSPARKRFIREALPRPACGHENVVRSTPSEQPLPYLVMEFITGQTLQQRSTRPVHWNLRRYCGWENRSPADSLPPALAG